MNENTTHVETTAEKFEAGHYVSFTWGGGTARHMASGAFHFRKSGKGWVVNHVDFTVEGSQEGTYGQADTLKSAQAFAQSVVRSLDANVARRRESALKGARPFTISSPVELTPNEKMRKIEALARELGLGVTHSARTETEGHRAGQVITSVIVEVVAEARM